MQKSEKEIATKSYKTDTRKKRVLKCLSKCVGVVTDACVMAKVTRETFYTWKKEDPDFAEAVRVIQEEECVDVLETAFWKKVNEEDTASILFGLKTKGKRRGWVEKTEIGIKTDETKIKIELE